MVCAMAPVAQSDQIRWFIGTAEVTGNKMMDVCLTSLTNHTTGNTAIIVAGKHDFPGSLPCQVLHGQAGYHEVLITVWTCDRKIGTSRVDHQRLSTAETFETDVHASVIP